MKKRLSRFLSVFLAALTACSLLSVSALADACTAEIHFKVIPVYQDSSKPLGYDVDYDNAWEGTLPCTYTSSHAVTANHQVVRSGFHPETIGLNVRSGYTWKGWAKYTIDRQSAETPPNGTFYTWQKNTENVPGTGTHMIYMVYAPAAPAQKTYVLYYDGNGGTNVPAEQTQQSAAGSADFTISGQIPLWNGHDFQGWSTDAAAQSAAYQPGDSITIRQDTTLYAVWKEHVHTDGDDDGYCDEDQTCMHDHDSEGYCTESGCTHPASCCPKRGGVNTPAAPGYPELSDLLEGLVRVACNTDAAAHTEETYGLLGEGSGYTLGAVQGSETEGYTLEVTLLRSAYASQFGTDKGKAHTATDGETDRTLTLEYDASAQSWKLLPAFAGGVRFMTVCQNAEDPDDKTNEPGMEKKADGSNSIGLRSPGDSIVFSLYSTVPDALAKLKAQTAGGDWTLEGSYELVFHDTMSRYLSFDSAGVTVWINGRALDAAYYTVDAALATGESFTVTMDLAEIFRETNLFTWADMGKAPIEVRYTATVDDDAPNGAALTNTAKVTYPRGESAESEVIGRVSVVTPPLTGGSGTAIFTVLGVALMGSAASLLVLKRRKNGAD